MAREYFALVESEDVARCEAEEYALWACGEAVDRRGGGYVTRHECGVGWMRRGRTGRLVNGPLGG